MNRRHLLAGAAALTAAAALPAAFAAPARAQDRPVVTFWHAMSGPLGEEVKKVCDAFNAAQSAVTVAPVFKGTYGETMTAAIAAFRAGQAPHLVQVFEVGTGSMLGAGPAVRQVWQLAQETGIAFDPAAYMPAVRSYYSLPDGSMAAMPFNSSTPVMWLNADLFERAGLDPAAPPATWQEVAAAADALKTKASAKVAMTTAWPTWVMMENFGALHDLPYATKANGFEGLDAELVFNAPPYVAQIQRLLDMAKAGTFTYGGRGAAGDQIFPVGETGLSFNSSAVRAAFSRDAKFRFAAALLPYDPSVRASPNNSIIGGASLWTMTAPRRTPAEYKAVADFLKFISQPDSDARWSKATGYVPVTLAGAGLSLAQGYYARTPGADIAIRQLNRGAVTENSKGLRLGRLPEIRTIIEEEFEAALQGRQGAQAALDSAVARGNKVLREFEKSMRG
ncbi:sn-glycerol-3-phosphate ABC transporter substrate-binding protein UgpB [Aquabacter spiritensis]|uniref:sn-glycerol-3-phosphate-binding periplasmic protein UgpB n=1 Tax=Aquabacter spiritensis TaxID=933073 RepID=A0A4R3LUW1_9HYPH|nr:sn-glycerol-3-phosphate ABC transporter substrate-binding protein UgpB [Aquabacter spiritensis]TCT04342.1 carbohydrate ABC transporter substrate-binding protein (CUT1 family) [Aquabacter spiritensis]